jgi:hypothetical protein
VRKHTNNDRLDETFLGGRAARGAAPRRHAAISAHDSHAVGTNQRGQRQWAPYWEPGGRRVETKVGGPPFKTVGCLWKQWKWPRNLAATTRTHTVSHLGEDYGRTAPGPRGEVSTKPSKGGMTTIRGGIGRRIPYQSSGPFPVSTGVDHLPAACDQAGNYGNQVGTFHAMPLPTPNHGRLSRRHHWRLC